MTIIEEGECRIQYLNHKGIGIGATPLGEVALPYTMEGELVRFERHSYRGKANCILKEIIEASPERQKPDCQYFGACGGCLLQHLPTNTYNALKYNSVLDALSSQNVETIINPIITVPPSNRRRANLEVLKKNDQIYLGFHRFRSHQIINIDQCPALLPQLSNLIVPIKQVFDQILEHRQKAQIFITNCDNGVDITITIQEQTTLKPEQRKILSEFAKKYEITRLLFRYRKSLDIIQEIAQPYITFGDIPVEIDAYSFLQSSSLSDQILQDLILKYLVNNNAHHPKLSPEKRGALGKFNEATPSLLDQALSDAHVVDLFCGRGTYTIPLSKYFKVDGFEFDQPSLDAISRAILNKNRPIKLEKRDLFTIPLSSAELNQYNFCTINPPRAGAKAQCLELAKSNIAKIVYVSCNSQSFALDAKILCEASYKLVEVTLLDQFYWSPHIELIGFFQSN